MRYISLFSGIEAATVAWEPLGWEPVAFCEIEKFPSAVLSYRFPNVPNLGDITKVDWSEYRGTIDVIVGGSPCQSFSYAGKREGLSGQSGLMFEYIRAVREIMPKYFVWENVPGTISSEKGGLSDSFYQKWMRSGMVWHGEYWTRNFSAWPQNASVSSLLEVLETCPAQKHFLSPKACAGILWRVNNKGIELDKQLEEELHKILSL